MCVFVFWGDKSRRGHGKISAYNAQLLFFKTLRRNESKERRDNKYRKWYANFLREEEEKK